MTAIIQSIIASTSGGGRELYAPTNLRVVYVESTISLYWDDVATETEYQVERSLDNVNFTQIGTRPANDTNYYDVIGIFPLTTYYYRVRAVNNDGVSPWSDTLAFTTPYESTVYIGSNSYITFGFGSTEYRNVSPSSPFGPKILIGGFDNSWQRVYDLLSGVAPNRTFRVRFEGTASTAGTPGNPNIVWEAVFFEQYVNKIELHIGVNANSPGGGNGVCSASSLIAAFPNGTVNTAYEIVTSVGAATVTPIALNLNGPTGMTQLIFNSFDDDYRRLRLPWVVNYLGIPY